MFHSTDWPPKADSVDCPSESNDTGSGNVGLWDKATIHEIDAMQRKRSSAGLRGHRYGGRDGMAASLSKAENQRSSGKATAGLEWIAVAGCCMIAPVEDRRTGQRSSSFPLV
jgi:hypothetical protein